MKKIVYILSFLFFSTLIGCTNQFSNFENTGISFTLPGNSRAIYNDVEISNFEASITGRNISQKLENLEPGETVTFEKLNSGEYTVTVNGFNKQKTKLVTGTEKAIVEAGKTTNLTIVLKWCDLSADITIGSLRVEIKCVDGKGKSIADGSKYYFIDENATLNFTLDTNAVDADKYEVLLNGKDVSAKVTNGQLIISLTKDFEVAQSNELYFLVEKDGQIKDAKFRFDVEYGLEVNSLLWSGDNFNYFDVVIGKESVSEDQNISENVKDFAMNTQGDLYVTSGITSQKITKYRKENSELKSVGEIALSSGVVDAMYVTDAGVYLKSNNSIYSYDSQLHQQQVFVYEKENYNLNISKFAVYNDKYLYSVFNNYGKPVQVMNTSSKVPAFDGNLNVYELSNGFIKDSTSINIFEVMGESNFGSVDITDIQCIENNLYVLVRQHNYLWAVSSPLSVYSRGAIVKITLSDDGKMTDSAVLGWWNPKDSDGFVYRNEDDEELEDFKGKYFFGCEKIVAIKPDELIIADDGIYYEGEYHISEDRLVCIDLKTFAIKNSVEFKNEYSVSTIEFDDEVSTAAAAIPGGFCDYNYEDLYFQQLRTR